MDNNKLELNKNNNIANNRLNMVLISNIFFDSYIDITMQKYFEQDGIHVEVVRLDHNEIFSRRGVGTLNRSDLIVMMLNLQSAYPDLSCISLDNQNKFDSFVTRELQHVKNITSFIKKHSSSLILWFGYEDYYTYDNYIIGNTMMFNSFVDLFNVLIANKYANDWYFIDTKRIIANVGTEKAYDHKNKYRWNSPYSRVMVDTICAEIHKQYLINKGATKKCIILDCDNVLWGGVLLEDGIENVNLGLTGLGRLYYDFQRFLVSLYYHGVILAVCSKNAENDVLRVFREHSEMLLKEEYIACFRVNWDNKVNNIKDIAISLNIGLDSIVFIDDSDFEIDSVRTLLPDVTSVKFEHDSIYKNLSCFNLKSNIDINNVEQRYLTYKTDEDRVRLKNQSQSFEEYLDSLGMVVDIHEAMCVEYARISELTQRTNKCTNGIRYTVDDIKRKISSADFHIYSVSVSDRFSNLGIVGSMAVHKNTMLLFSLSCRALGREIETKMLQYIERQHSIDTMVFCSTKKNDEILQLIQNRLCCKINIIENDSQIIKR